MTLRLRSFTMSGATRLVDDMPEYVYFISNVLLTQGGAVA